MVNEQKSRMVGNGGTAALHVAGAASAAAASGVDAGGPPSTRPIRVKRARAVSLGVSALATTDGLPRFDMVIELSPDILSAATRREWGADQRLDERADGTVHLSFTSPRLTEVAQWLAGCGGLARAVAPHQLVDAVIELHCRGIEAHQAGVVYYDGARSRIIERRR